MSWKHICKSVLIFFAFCYSLPITAKHIIGGDVTYSCINRDTINNTVTFAVEFIMYRDCNDPTGADFDSNAEFGVWRQQGTSWVFVKKTAQLNFRNRQSVTPSGNTCLIIPPNVCVEKASYEFNVTLDVINQNYLIAYQRCCRNTTITNIIDPGGTGAVFSVEITPTAQNTCNNSPRFNDFPPIVICADFEIDFDHSATDADGDQLVYGFCTPISAGGQNTMEPGRCDFVQPNPTICGPTNFSDVRYLLPRYSTDDPIGGDPTVTLNVNSGLISGIPNTLGQFVVGVCVQEFREGELIGVIRRDFQFNVTTCEPTVFAQLQADEELGGKQFLINSCGVNTIEFRNESFDQNFIEEYLWTFDVGNGEVEIVQTRNATVTFPGVGEYGGTMVLNPGTECSDTAEIFVNVYPSIEADYTFEYDTCVAGPVSFMDLSNTGADFLTDWQWDFRDGDQGQGQTTSHLFDTPGFKDVILTVTDNNQCTDTISKTIDWRPVPPLIVVEPDNFIGCLPANIFFNNLSSPIDETYEITWDFGDGKTGDEISPTHVYEEEGIYTVSIEIVSPIGCETSRTFPNWINIKPKPTADFSFTPETLNSFTKTASFFDQSIGAIGYLWDFNGEGTSVIRNPTHTFQDTGIAYVDLIVLHESGCTDTATAIIDIIPEVTFFMPNAFTPNADATNDLFMGKGITDGITDFSMTIWSRWGEMVYSTDDVMDGWNGQMNNVGSPLPNGVYVYVVTYRDPRGIKQELNGFATLIR